MAHLVNVILGSERAAIDRLLLIVYEHIAFIGAEHISRNRGNSVVAGSLYVDYGSHFLPGAQIITHKALAAIGNRGKGLAVVAESHRRRCLRSVFRKNIRSDITAADIGCGHRDRYKCGTEESNG